jgi:transposase-like protein
MVVASEPVRVTCNGRRYFSKAHKDAVIAKCLTPGASLAAVALANGFNANLVRKWVRQRQARQPLSKSNARLLPVTIEQEQAPASNASARAGRSAACGSMQIRIGRVELVVRGAVGREQLSVVLDTLLRSR